MISDDEYLTVKRVLLTWSNHENNNDPKPEDLANAIAIVEKKERIGESTAMRKLLRIGFEDHVTKLYKEGKVTLRKASRLLRLNQIEVINLFPGCRH